MSLAPEPRSGPLVLTSLLGAGGGKQTAADGQPLERPVTAGPGGGLPGSVRHAWSSGHGGVPEVWVEVLPTGR